MEFPLALDDEGRVIVGGSMGELRPTGLGSMWVGWMGVDAIEGDRAALVAAVAAAVLLRVVSTYAKNKIT